jgi:hypothetical protein
MAASPYLRPPITEAVIEFRFGAPASIEQVEKVKDLLIGDYPVVPRRFHQKTVR